MTRSKLKLIVILFLALLLPVCTAWGAFKTDEPLVSGGNPLISDPLNVRLAWNPASGRLGLAFIDNGASGLAYAEWQPGAGIVLKEKVAPDISAVLGLACTAAGLPRIGATGGPTVTEQVKGADGKWTSVDTGIAPDNRFRYGAYALNPVSGHGAFLLNTAAGAAAGKLRVPCRRRLALRALRRRQLERRLAGLHPCRRPHCRLGQRRPTGDIPGHHARRRRCHARGHARPRDHGARGEQVLAVGENRGRPG